MMNTIFMRRPEALDRDLAHARLMTAFPGALLRFEPLASLEISYETEAESRSGAIHEAAFIVRALLAAADNISVTAVVLEDAAQHPDRIPFQLRTATETYACDFRAFTESPDA